MKIALYSDTHGLHRNFWPKEKVDLLIHCGDFTGLGKKEEVLAFNKWLLELLDCELVDEIVVVPGNHELEISKNPWWYDEIFNDPQIHILIDKTIELYGMKIHGSPWTTKFFNWAYMDDEDKLYQRWIKSIPNDVDILITHGPPKGILDDNSLFIRCGSQALRDIVLDIKPTYHIFGHIHEGFGQKEMVWDSNLEDWIHPDDFNIENPENKKITFLNVSSLTGQYIPRKNIPIIIEI